MKRAFVFPGQGSQAVGMVKALAESSLAAREVLQEVDEALKQSLSRLMFEGPIEELTLTENAQPALLAASMAVLRVLEKDGGIGLTARIAYVAGHSLGEYSALAAAGTFSLADAARLLKRRGQAMQRAVPVGAGAMAAVLGLDVGPLKEVAKAAAQSQVCAVANDNAPGQVVLSGHADAIERAIPLATEKGAKRCIKLPVSAPFHCALMAPAADEMKTALAEVTMKPPAVPLVANVTAEAVAEADRIRALLVEQVTAMVRWRECVGYLKAQGVGQVIELGAGKVLSGLVKRIEPELAALSVGTPAEVEAALKAL
jgi:[acyl-carrier-protein] S-malonyltransferase